MEKLQFCFLAITADTCVNCICAYVYMCISRVLCGLAENSVSIYIPFIFFPLSSSLCKLPLSWCDGPGNIENPSLFQKNREHCSNRLAWRKWYFCKNPFNISCRIRLKTIELLGKLSVWGNYIQSEVLTCMLRFVTQCESTAVQRGETSCWSNE